MQLRRTFYLVSHSRRGIAYAAGRPSEHVPKWLPSAAAAVAVEAGGSNMALEPSQVYSHMQQLLRQHERFYDQECLVLEGATNVPNPRIVELSATTIGTRASLGLPGAKHETGLQHVEQVELLASHLLQRLFDVRFAEVRPQSAMAWTTIANARRLMTKDPEVEKQAVITCKLPEQQIAQANLKTPKLIIPKHRLSTKTKAADVLNAAKPDPK